MGIWGASKTRIDFNDDWATLGPPEFNAGWPPAKVESSQTAQRKIGDTCMLFSGQKGREGELTKYEMRWVAKLSSDNPDDLISHYVSAIVGALCEFFD
ncbi:hypothetical protein X736_31030 [Mesorhizobium sp. L2C089B000]|nr:hypothetical protein X736_31030 [Mesorhizobium sp. L2C089B000]